MHMQRVLYHFKSWHDRYPDIFNNYHWHGHLRDSSNPSQHIENQPEEIGVIEFFKAIFDETTSYLRLSIKGIGVEAAFGAHSLSMWIWSAHTSRSIATLFGRPTSILAQTSIEMMSE